MPNTPTRSTQSSPRPACGLSKTPVQAPRANAICEQWVASARRECTDRILIAGQRHLHHTLSEYVDHYNTTGRIGPSARDRPTPRSPPRLPRRATSAAAAAPGPPSETPPDPSPPAAPGAEDNIRVRRRDRLGGLIHEYSQAA